MTPGEIISFSIGATLIYVVIGAMTGCLPIKNGALRAVAMALWPVALVAGLLYLPFLIWRAAEDDVERLSLLEVERDNRDWVQNFCAGHPPGRRPGPKPQGRGGRGTARS